jgi:DUF3102 family protein
MTTSEVERLGTLAARINAEHRACVSAMVDTLEHAMNAGYLLREAKAECPHGRWLRWLEDNFEGSVRTAQVYMRLARDRFLLPPANAQGSALLSIDGALRALVEAKDTTPIVDLTARAQMQGRALPPDEEVEVRISDATFVLRAVAELLNGALDPDLALRPEEASEVLRRAKDGDRLAGGLRSGVAWLVRALDAAEQ